jgi:hypothetical protein
MDSPESVHYISLTKRRLPMKILGGKVAIFTGASSGLGEAAAFVEFRLSPS